MTVEEHVGQFIAQMVFQIAKISAERDAAVQEVQRLTKLLQDAKIPFAAAEDGKQ